jgi:tryptophanyl-tRNA synthetase
MSSTIPAKRKQVLSAIQPTGNLHLGRYFGAVQNWVNLQNTYDCIYGMVDYHAITMPFRSKKIKGPGLAFSF